MKRVLYVEHSTTAQLLMRRCLADLCEVTAANTLAVAFRLWDERNFDLLITDFLFREGDVFELIEHVRQTASWEQVPIVILSSSIDRILTTRMIRAGANETSPKPFASDEFRMLIKRLLASPYVRTVKETAQGVTCFQWKASGLVHQYCPELHLAVSARTKTEASQKMKALLEEHHAKGAPMGMISQESTVTHVVRS
jgi:CheY-like chemotaxis protein